MAQKDVTIRISATDAASPVFRKIGGEAKAMGSSVDSAANASSRNMENFSRKSAAMGAAIGAAALTLGEFTRAAAEDAANQARLQQSVENTGKAYDQYADAIDNAIKAGQNKAFSDDDTREALVRLNAVTNDTGASLNELGLVMDFARARGISMADSAGIIAKVMGGNVSILKRYGLAIEDGATATEALAVVQQRSAGQAAVYADSQMGHLDRMKDKFAELQESIGASTGQLQGFLMLLPGLSAGATALAGIIAGIGGFGVLAGLAAAGGAGVLAYDANTNAYGKGSNIFAQFGSKGAGLANDLLPGNPFTGIQGQFDSVLNGNTLVDAVSKLFYQTPGTVSNQDAGDWAVGRLRAAGIIPGSFDGTIDEAAKYISSQANVVGMSNTQYVQRRLSVSPGFVYDPITGQYINPDTYQEIDTQRRLAALPTYPASPYSYDSMSKIAAGGASQPVRGSTTAYDWAQHFEVQRTTMGKASVYAAPANVFAREQGDDLQASMVAMAAGSVNIAKQTQAAAERFNTAMIGYADQLGLQGSISKTPAGTLAAGASNANANLEGGFRVAVGNTNAISDQADQIDKWAKELINIQGIYGGIDDLLATGRISLEEYWKAQDAGNRIFQATSDIEDDVAAIQAKQAPIIADLTQQQALYMNKLADMPAAQQAVQLAYMDSGESAKALAAANLAAAASSGELGAAGEATATKMITAAAQADPYLRLMLEDMGLISVGADGTITVNFGDVTNANTETSDLIGAVQSLTELLANVFRIQILSNAAESAAPLYEILNLLAAIDGRQVTYSIMGNSFISGPTPPLPGIFADGGTINQYAGGATHRANWWNFAPSGGSHAIVGERGPEMVWLPNGAQVTNTEATKSRMYKGMRSNDHLVQIFGSVNLQMNNPDIYSAISSQVLGGAR